MPITYRYRLFLVRDGGANKHHSIISKTRGVNMMLDVFKAFSRNEDVSGEVWAVTLFLDNLSAIHTNDVCSPSLLANCYSVQ